MAGESGGDPSGLPTRWISWLLAAKCFTWATTRWLWMPWISAATICPARNGSSPRVSAVRPHLGVRRMLTVGPSSTLNPLPAVSAPSALPNRRASAVHGKPRNAEAGNSGRAVRGQRDLLVERHAREERVRALDRCPAGGGGEGAGRRGEREQQETPAGQSRSVRHVRYPSLGRTGRSCHESKRPAKPRRAGRRLPASHVCRAGSAGRGAPSALPDDAHSCRPTRPETKSRVGFLAPARSTSTPPATHAVDRRPPRPRRVVGING